MQHGGNGAGRKREWRPMENISADDERNTDAYSSYNGSHNGLQGEPIEKEMKKLRLAHDYDASQSAWSSTNHAQQWTAIAAAEPMEVEGQDAMEGGEANHNYAAKNNLLRECHYLRQLRKFQSERVRERASYFERRNPGVDAQTPYLHEPRY